MEKNNRFLPLDSVQVLVPGEEIWSLTKDEFGFCEQEIVGYVVSDGIDGMLLAHPFDDTDRKIVEKTPNLYVSRNVQDSIQIQIFSVLEGILIKMGGN